MKVIKQEDKRVTVSVQEKDGKKITKKKIFQVFESDLETVYKVLINSLEQK